MSEDWNETEKEKLIEINDGMWKCPTCGAGFDDGEGLVITPDEYVDEAHYDGPYPAGLRVECWAEDENGNECGWTGTVSDVAEEKKLCKERCFEAFKEIMKEDKEER